MRSSVRVLAVAVGIVLAGQAFAGPSRSSSPPAGRSSVSSGSSSKSFGSGTTYRQSPTPAPPAKSFGSGQPAKPPAAPPPPPPAPAGKSFGSGTAAKPPTPSPSQPPPSTGPPKGKSFASGGDGRPPAPSASAPKVPSGPSVNDAAARANQREQSQKAFAASRGAAPAPTYKDSSGTERKIDPKDPKVDYLRGRLDQAKWESRQSRQQAFFGSYYHAPAPLVVYHDPFPPFFMGWLLGQSLDTRAMWCYHHRSEIEDSGRYRDLLAKDAQLEARVRALEAQNLRRDVTYTPPGLPDPDLQYDDRFIRGVYNPQPAYVPPATYAPPPQYAGGGVSGWAVLKAFLWIMFFVGLGFLVFWLVFIRRS